MSGTTYVYFIQQGYGDIKIGVSSDPDERLAALQTGTSKALRVIARFPFASRKQAMTIERQLHRKYWYLRVNGEWFRSRLLKEMKVNGRRIIGGTAINPEGGLAGALIEPEHLHRK